MRFHSGEQKNPPDLLPSWRPPFSGAAAGGAAGEAADAGEGEAAPPAQAAAALHGCSAGAHGHGRAGEAAAWWRKGWR